VANDERASGGSDINFVPRGKESTAKKLGYSEKA